MASHRQIPSIEHLLQRPALEHAARDRGRAAVTEAVREAAAEYRAAMTAPLADHAESRHNIAERIEARALALVRTRTSPSLRTVINATGVLLHTNLGRAPLAESAAAAAAALTTGYTNLEFDLAAGARGHRHVHAATLLCKLTGAEAALVVNNAAAAALLSMAALAAGREVIVSRGELVEIGGGFRVPEVLAQSGAVLREVGTTNRTRVADYAAAISDRTALILRVHPSNFHIEGFTERPSLPDLARLAGQFTLPLVEDLGSGWLGVMSAPDALAHEPSVHDSITAGADLVIFSGDKLLGGPQAGIVVGQAALVDRLSRHPLMRALRADKLTYAALEATLRLWLAESMRQEIPLVRMLTANASEIEQRADKLIQHASTTRGLVLMKTPGQSTIGGGSASGSALPSTLLRVRVQGLSADDLLSRLRENDPPVIGRIHDDDVVLDLRTVADAQDDVVLQALVRLAQNV